MISPLIYFSTSDFVCNADNCLSWIIILLNILTIFYLVFCAWFKVTKTIRLAGVVWAGVLAIASIVLVVLHTCLYSVLSIVFTGLVIMAVLAVSFNKEAIASEATGAYVIHKTDKGNYVFAIYNNRKKMVARSYYRYPNIEEVKEVIASIRKDSKDITFERKKKDWVEVANYPKFEIVQKDGKFGFVLSISVDIKLLRSEVFNSEEECRKAMKVAPSITRSSKTYFAEADTLSDDSFENHK